MLRNTARCEIGVVRVNLAARTVSRAGRSRVALTARREYAHCRVLLAAAPERSRYPHYALRTSLRRKRRHALESARCACLQCAQETRPRLHRHAPRPWLQHRNMSRFPRSLRWRLQLWYGAMLVAVLGGFGFTAFHLERTGPAVAGDVDDGLGERVSVLVERAAGSRGIDGANQQSRSRPPIKLPPCGRSALRRLRSGYYYACHLDAPRERRAASSSRAPRSQRHVPKPDSRGSQRVAPARATLRETFLFAPRRWIACSSGSSIRRGARPTADGWPRCSPRWASWCWRRASSAAGGSRHAPFVPWKISAPPPPASRPAISPSASPSPGWTASLAASARSSTRPSHDWRPRSPSRRVLPPTPRTSCAHRSP